MRDKVAQDLDNLSEFSSNIAEYVAVKVQYGGRDMAVVTVHARSGSQHM